MESEGWEIIRLELKYCERCGGLWLRRRNTGGVYCAGCSSETSEFPLCGRRISRPRLPTNGTLEIESQDRAIRFIVCGGRGHA
jgi:hypothetical protein